MQPPEPSPAPTLDHNFPGFYRSTTASTFAPSDESHDDYDDTTQPYSALEQAEEVLENTAKALYGTAASVAGGLLGSLGLSQSRSSQGDDGTATPKAAGSRPSTAKKEDKVDETHRPEFGDDAVENEKAALAASPAQALISDDREEGSKLTGEGALGSALLAGAAGAKVVENEVRSPTTEADDKERMGGIEEPAVASPPAPTFSTKPDDLSSSPAQRLLRSITSSSITKDETALLAGAAGATSDHQDLGEPANAPLDKLAEKSAEAGAPLGKPKGNEEEEHEEKSVPLKREISSPPSPQLEHDRHLSSLSPSSSSSPSPLPTLPHQDSQSSFAAAVLGAAEGVSTPTETGAREASGFGDGPREILASDVFEEPKGAEKPTPTVADVATAPATAVAPKEDDSEVVHNPAPLVPAALAGTAAGASLLGPEAQADAPRDFEPYAAPVVEQSPEAKVAAATPLPETPGLGTAPTSKSFAPAIIGAGGLYPNSPDQTVTPLPNATASASTETIPATVNAQNVKAVVDPVEPTEAEEDHSKRNAALAAGAGAAGAGGLAAALSDRNEGEKPTNSSAEEIPMQTALAAGPDGLGSAAPAFTGAGAAALPTETVDHPEHGSAPAVTNALAVKDVVDPVEKNASVPHATHPEHFEEGDEKPFTREEKGKGREVPLAEGAAVGAGAGFLGNEAISRENEIVPPSSAFQENLNTAPGVVSQPTSSTIDTLGADSTLSKPDSFSDQRAFPTVPHFNRAAALNSTDEPVLDSSAAESAAAPLDPKVLAAESKATSPEQAGFAPIPAGAPMTAAAQDFAHLSTPAPAPFVGDAVGAEEKREYEEGTGRDKLPLIAAAGASVGAGALGAGIIAHDHAAKTAPAPPVGAPPAATTMVGGAVPAQPVAAGMAPTPVQAAVLPTQAQPVQPVQPVQPIPTQQQLQPQTPVSRFTEQTYAGRPGAETPSSTCAVKGTPAGSSAETTPASSVNGGRTPPQQPAFQQQAHQPINLIDAGIVERSPHLHIQTTKSETGHKRLHRKSLSGATAALVAPRHAPQQPQQGGVVQTAPSGVTGFDGEARRPHLPTIQSEGRRERMMVDIVGVRDPTYAAVPSASSHQPPLSSSAYVAQPRTSTSSAGSSASLVNGPSHAHRASGTITPPSSIAPTPVLATGSPQQNQDGVSRKLSKARRGSEAGEKKEGFFSRLMHGGAGHKRTASGGSHGSVGSPRASGDVAR
ncbi:hypothetical protein JCM8547_002550 [Rhodosporidiobolus lusitaniae]